MAILVAFPLALCRASGHGSSRQCARILKCTLHGVTGQASRPLVPANTVVCPYLHNMSDINGNEVYRLVNS